MTLRTPLLATAAGFVFIVSSPTQGSADQITVSATIAGTCSMDADALLGFGSFDGTPKETSTQFTVNCTSGTNVDVSLNEGQNGNGSRRMVHETQVDKFLGYSLFNGEAFGGAGDVWTPGASRNFDLTSGATLVTVGGLLSGSTLGLPAGAYEDIVQVTFGLN